MFRCLIFMILLLSISILKETYNYANDSVLFTDIESSLRLCKCYIEKDITSNKILHYAGP